MARAVGANNSASGCVNALTVEQTVNKNTTLRIKSTSHSSLDWATTLDSCCWAAVVYSCCQLPSSQHKTVGVVIPGVSASFLWSRCVPELLTVPKSKKKYNSKFAIFDIKNIFYTHFLIFAGSISIMHGPLFAWQCACVSEDGGRHEAKMVERGKSTAPRKLVQLCLAPRNTTGAPGDPTEPFGFAFRRFCDFCQ